MLRKIELLWLNAHHQIGKVMNKMYYAKQVVDVCFVIEEGSSPCTLNGIAKDFLKEEAKNHVPGRLTTIEVKGLADIPKSWWQATYYGDNPHDCTPAGFLQDPEYKEFLRLKAKFEDHE
jgi:hypothetical protein